MSNQDDDLISSPAALKEIHRSQGIVPMMSRDDSSLMNLEEVKWHRSLLDELNRYLMLVENAQDVNEVTAPKLLAQLSYGFRKSGEYLALAKYNYKEAKAERKRAEAVAALDNFMVYVAAQKAKGAEIKATDASRAAYVNIDPEVREASKKESLFEAMVEQLFTIKTEFLMSISTIKSIAYGYKDSDSMSGTSTSVNESE